jgi:hypothetical protein
MLWLELTAWLDKEIAICETAKRDWNIDATRWECRRKALEEVKKKINGDK